MIETEQLELVEVVLVIGNWSFGFVCDLVLAIWYFMSIQSPVTVGFCAVSVPFAAGG